jgi:hypothetical protein
MKSENLNFLEPSGPLQACNGTALPLPLHILIFLYLSKTTGRLNIDKYCTRLGESSATKSDKTFARCQPHQLGAEVSRFGEHPCFHNQKITVKESETGQRNVGNFAPKGHSWLSEKKIVVIHRILLCSLSFLTARAKFLGLERPTFQWQRATTVTAGHRWYIESPKLFLIFIV